MKSQKLHRFTWSFLKTTRRNNTNNYVCFFWIHFIPSYKLFFVKYLTLGIKGSIELATGLNSINMILELLIYFMIPKKSLKSWNGARLMNSNFQSWKPLLSLALPSCISICLEWRRYEIVMFYYMVCYSLAFVVFISVFLLINHNLLSK